MRHLFITGCGRSGTTMLGSILGACNNSVATPESQFFLEYPLQRHPNRISKYDFLNFLEGNYRFRQWEIPATDILFEESDFSPFDLRQVVEKTVIAYATANAKIDRLDITRIDHTPSNIKFFRKLNESFPDAKYVFMVRDPRAVYASMRDLDWGANSALKLSSIWIEYAALYFAVQRLIPNQTFLVRYEDIVSKPNKFVKKICRFCELEFHPEIVKGGGFKLPKYTQQQHAQVGKAPNTANIDKWRKKLSARDVLILESKCGTVMNAFGYNYLKPDNYNVGFQDELASLFIESYSYIANKIRKRKREKLA